LVSENGGFRPKHPTVITFDKILNMGVISCYPKLEILVYNFVKESINVFENEFV
jgi:hypothetical protein